MSPIDFFQDVGRTDQTSPAWRLPWRAWSRPWLVVTLGISAAMALLLMATLNLGAALGRDGALDRREAIGLGYVRAVGAILGHPSQAAGFLSGLRGAIGQGSLIGGVVLDRFGNRLGRFGAFTPAGLEPGLEREGRRVWIGESRHYQVLWSPAQTNSSFTVIAQFAPEQGAEARDWSFWRSVPVETWLAGLAAIIILAGLADHLLRPLLRTQRGMARVTADLWSAEAHHLTLPRRHALRAWGDGYDALLAAIGQHVRDSEARLRLSEQRSEQFGAAFDAAPAPMLLIDPRESRVRIANRQARRILGQDGGRLAGAALKTLCPGFPEALLRAGERGPGAAPFDITKSNLLWRTASGKEMELDGVIRQVDGAGRSYALLALQTPAHHRKRAIVRRPRGAKGPAKSRTQSDFISNISHELRTPLHAIVGFVGMLERSDSVRSDLRAVEYLGYIREGGQQLLSMVNRILSLSRISDKPAEFVGETVNLGGFAREVALSHPAMLRADMRLELSFEIEDRSHALIADTEDLEVMIGNLLSNAFAYTQTPGRITLRTQLGPDGGLRLEIQDTGCGIPAAHLPYVTDPFHRVDGGLCANQQGAGLGLAVVKAMIERHGGYLSIQSVEGEGTEVTLVFPASRTTAWSFGVDP